MNFQEPSSITEVITMYAPAGATLLCAWLMNRVIKQNDDFQVKTDRRIEESQKKISDLTEQVILKTSDLKVSLAKTDSALDKNNNTLKLADMNNSSLQEKIDQLMNVSKEHEKIFTSAKEFHGKVLIYMQNVKGQLDRLEYSREQLAKDVLVLKETKSKKE